MSEQSWDQMTDPELLQRALGPASPRERELALKAMYDRYSGYVLGLCGFWLQDPDDSMDAAQSTFATLIEALPSLREPAKLRSFIAGIAKNQCREIWRQRGREGEFPDRDPEDVEHEIKATARRQAEVDRMLDAVAVSLTSKQGQTYQLVFRQGIRGQALAAQLSISERDANDLTYETGRLLADGFGAYVLARDGRRFCTNLAGILDKTAWDGVTFTHLLRQRILWHLGDCPNLCDNCPICNPQKRKLIASYTPVTIPILLAAELHDRIYQLIENLTTPSGPADPGQSDDGGIGAAADGSAGSRAGAAVDAMLDDYVSPGKPADDAGHPARESAIKVAPQPGKGRGRISGRPLAVVAAVVAAVVVVVAVLLASGSSGASGMPITATSALAPLTGYTYVQYLGGSDASASISGQVSDAASGEVVQLYARQFPFTAAPSPSASLTLPPSGTYSFRVTPSASQGSARCADGRYGARTHRCFRHALQATDIEQISKF